MKRAVSVFVLIGLVLIGPARVFAADRDPLVKLLIKKGVITEQEVREMEAELAAQEKANPAAPPTAPAQEEIKAAVKEVLPDWVKKMTWSGDLRLRHETQFRDPSVNRNRERFRLRFGFTTKPWDPLEIGVRLATGASGDPVSTNQSFTSTFDKKAVFIDKAYAKYTPVAGLNIIGGKMDNPFDAPTEIVWDADVTPEGVAIQWKSPNPLPILKDILPTRPFINIGAFQISELNGDRGDPAMFGFQVGKEVSFPCGLNWVSSVGFYETTAVKGKRTSDINQVSAPSGNSTDGPAAAPVYRYDYDVVDVQGKLSIPKVLGQPVALIGDWAHNPGAKDNNGAWQAGLEAGKVTEKLGSWKAFYFYKRVEPDAVLGAITDSDFGAGGTNHKGHVMGVQVGLNKVASLGVRYLRTDEVNGTQNKVDTLQADVNLKY